MHILYDVYWQKAFSLSLFVILVYFIWIEAEDPGFPMGTPT